MKTACIIHGGLLDRTEYFSDDYPSMSNSHWIPWLQKQLLKNGYLAQTPEMPHPYAIDYDEWKTVFERHPVNHDTILIGHSCGAGFLLRWLSENIQPVERVILVAPYLDPEKAFRPEFFDFVIDESLAARSDTHVVFSDSDMVDVMTTVRILRTQLPSAAYHAFPGYGHFCFKDMNTHVFPELFELALTGRLGAHYNSDFQYRATYNLRYGKRVRTFAKKILSLTARFGRERRD